MNRNWSRLGLVSAIVLLLWMMPSCGRDQVLESITIQPAVETFGAASIPVSDDAGLNVQLKANGSYIHPPVTKDITGQATWFSNTPGMVTVTPAGLLSATGLACGNALVSATLQTNTDGNETSTGAVVTGYMTANVVCFTGTGAARSAEPALTANFAGAGSGTITSSPLGLSCATTCSANFASGTPVTLTAAPIAGSGFGSWVGCDSVKGLVCTVNVSGERAVTVTFN